MKHFYKQFLLFSIIMLCSSLIAMEEKEEVSTPISKTPHYDCALKCFTNKSLSLMHYASKQAARNFVSYFDEIDGNNIDKFSTRTNDTFAPLPLELHSLIEQQTLLEAAKNGYTFEYRKKVSEEYRRENNIEHYNTSTIFSVKDSILEIKNIKTGNKREVPFKYFILNLCKSPQEQLIAVTEYNQITFLENNDEAWNVISTIPQKNARYLGFLDNTTAIFFDPIDTINICTYKDRKFSISQQKLDCAPQGLIGHGNVLFFFDLRGTLYACQSTIDGNFLKKIRENGSTQPFGPLLVSKNNYVVLQGDQADLTVISNINGTLSFIKNIKYNEKRYLRNFEDGILTIKKIDNTPGHFTAKKLKSISIDIDTEKIVNAFEDTFYTEPLLNLPFNAILAAIALSNSSDKDSLIALESSLLVENLAEEYKSYILAKISKQQSTLLHY